MYPYDGRFYAQAKALVRSQRGWLKPLLVLAAAAFVPVVGPLAALGYCLEYARLVAWGVDAAPKQKNVQVGACIKAGWRGVVAGLGATALSILIELALTYVFGNQSGFAGFFSTLIGMFCVTISCVCAVHAAVYQNYRAGYKRRVRDMITTDFRSVIRITCIYMLLCLGVGGLLSLDFLSDCDLGCLGRCLGVHDVQLDGRLDVAVQVDVDLVLARGLHGLADLEATAVNLDFLLLCTSVLLLHIHFI